jgi:hypothetical protein
MKKIINKILREYRFETGMFGLFFNPVYFTNKYEVEAINNYNEYIEGKVLDVGCGDKPHE